MWRRPSFALLAVAGAVRLRTSPMDAHAAAASEYSPQAASDHFAAAAGEIFVPVVGDGIRPVDNLQMNRTGAARLRQRKLALLNAQWRGGSTLAEQLIFSTTIAPPFLLDEPAKAMWLDTNNHLVSTVNFDALRCDFSKFNHTLLLNWQHWRGEFTRQRKLLNYRSFEEMRRRCFSAGNGGHVRAVKTIRMQGELDQVGRQCMRERTDGNYSCLLLQLVRHPMATLRSERHSSRLPQARGVKNPTLVAPGGVKAWMDSRAGNMSGFCEPILKDVQYALALKRRKARLERNGKLAVARTIPDVMILKYDDLIRRPLDVVKEAHAMLSVFTRCVCAVRVCGGARGAYSKIHTRDAARGMQRWHAGDVCVGMHCQHAGIPPPPLPLLPCTDASSCFSCVACPAS